MRQGSARARLRLIARPAAPVDLRLRAPGYRARDRASAFGVGTRRSAKLFLPLIPPPKIFSVFLFVSFWLAISSQGCFCLRDENRRDGNG